MRHPTGTLAAFDRAARRLVDAFFLEQDQQLIARLRALREVAETKEALAGVSGIASDVVLARLVALGVEAETLAALAAVPLIEVAWADGEIAPEERAVVLAHAGVHGVGPGSVARELLECWLAHPPTPELFEAWRAYIRDLAARFEPAERALLKAELLRTTTATAEAAGGFLGVGRVSPEERVVLDALAAAFEG